MGGVCPYFRVTHVRVGVGAWGLRVMVPVSFVTRLVLVQLMLHFTWDIRICF